MPRRYAEGAPGRGLIKRLELANLTFARAGAGPAQKPNEDKKTMTKAQLDHNMARLSTAEPYFAPNFAAARPLLDSAKASGEGLRFPSGATCGPEGCSCGNRGCLHTTAWRVYHGS